MGICPLSTALCPDLLSFGNRGAYGGALQYLKWATGRTYKAEDREEFFKNKKCNRLFKQHVQTLLRRKNTFNNVTYR